MSRHPGRSSAKTRRQIPHQLLGVCAVVAADRETHATLDSLFTHAGAVGEPPNESKEAKALKWLRSSNSDPAVTDPLSIAEHLLAHWIEVVQPERIQKYDEHRELLLGAAQAAGLRFHRGKLSTGASLPSESLANLIQSRNLSAIEHEFSRALEKVETEPREAVSAACNLLEDVFKEVITEAGHALPRKKDVRSLWDTVRTLLGFDPGQLADDDLKMILSGLSSVVQGTGALRTHASSAHGHARWRYNLRARHARLAVHGAHTVALFVLETWFEKVE